jgi:hypothetical protein
MTEFAAPAAGDRIQWADVLGHLVVVDVESLERDVETPRGPKDAIRAVVHDVDAQTTYEDTLVFPKVLVSSLKPRVGQKVLGRIGQGVAKPGENPPWIIEDASADPAAAKKATDYLAAYAAGQFAAPEQPAAAPTAPAAPQVDLSDPNVVAALAALQAQQKAGTPF